MQKNDWLSKLAALGVQPEDVTLVINTHLHLDHVGWNTKLVDGVWTPTFPRARHIMPRLEVDLAKAGKMTAPEEAAVSRRAFLVRCADEGWAMAPTHFFVPRVTNVLRVGDGFDLIM